MFGTQESRQHRAEQLATQAWEHLATALDSAGTSTRSARRRAAGYVDGATDRVGSGATEARRRASAALDALAGRRPSKPWGWLAGAAAAGAALGWVASVLAQRSRLSLRELPMALEGEEILGEAVRR